MIRLNQLLIDTRVGESGLHSHVLLGGIKGKVNIGSTRLLEFWNLYTKALSDPKNDLYLAEKPLSEVPVLVDVDLKTRIRPTDRLRDLYTLDDVKRIIKVYQSTLQIDILENVTSDALVCVLLQKPPRIVQESQTYVKHGFHLHFPKCFIDVNVQKAYLVPIVSNRLKGMFDHLYTLDDGHSIPDDIEKNFTTSKLKNDVHYKFLDESSVTVHWLMYGSKKQDSIPYLATKCFSGDCKEISFETAFHDYILPKFSGETTPKLCKDNVMECIPRILSIRLHGRNMYYYKAKSSVNTPVIEMLTKKFAVRRNEFMQHTISENLEEVAELLPLLSDARAEERSDWLSVGFSLHSITEGDADGLSLWLEFSYRSSKCNEAECICIWDNMCEDKGKGHTIGTIKYFAKLDSPYEYDLICRKKGDNLIGKAVAGGHNDIAKLLYNEYGNEFVYSTTNGKWYQFKDHIWHEDKACYDLSERISNDRGAVISQFEEHIRQAKANLNKLGQEVVKPKKKRLVIHDNEENPDDTIPDILREKISALTKLIKQCKNCAFKSSVMKECQEVFRNITFSDKLNTDPYLVAFKNGVYDFKNDCFRNGKPEDYLSVSVSISYKEYKSTDDPEIQEVADFFRKVLPDDEVRRYFLDQACQLFIGGNHDKVFCIWTGSGDNGKSVTQRLFEKLLGDLAVKISTSLITGDKAKLGQATPELARTGRGVRWVVMDEPGQNEQITTGLLKALTGNDSFYARDLYEGGKTTKEIVPLFKLNMLCNKLPTIKRPDEACWERVRVFPFESKFLSEDKCPSSLEDQLASKTFPRDPHFVKKLDKLLPPFAWYLIYHLRCLNKQNRVIPDKVRIATNMYKEENNNDPTQEFKDDELTKDPKGEVSVDELTTRYRDWWKINYSGEKLVATKKVIINMFSIILGDVVEVTTRGGIKKKVFKGYKWGTHDDSSDNTNPLL